MLIVDRLLVGGIKFVLGKVAAAVDAELNDATRLREELLAAQMRVELGEMTQAEFDAFEADLLPRLRALRDEGAGGAGAIGGELRVARVDVSTDDED